MKSSLKNIAAVCALMGACAAVNAASVTVDPAAGWVGYMNVFAKPAGGYPAVPLGAWQWGSGWGTADLNSSWSGGVVTLSPNTIGDPDPYWYTPLGGPGAVGNWLMGANLYVETPSGLFTGQTLTFTGDVLSNTLFGNLDPSGNGWTSVAFIKDFAPDYASFNVVTAPLVNGVFTISMDTANDPARHIQYGFETIGPNVWITDVAQYGNIQVTAVPEPGTMALLALGLLPLLFRRQQ